MNLRPRGVHALLLVGAGIFHTHAAEARDVIFGAHTKTGAPTLIRTFFNCIRHVPGGNGAAIAEHGSAELKFVTGAHCGNANEPANEVWYTSNPGFKGIDNVTIPVGPWTNVIVRVTVH